LYLTITDLSAVCHTATFSLHPGAIFPNEALVRNGSLGTSTVPDWGQVY